MKTLLVTDLHFVDKPRGLLEAQKACIKVLLALKEVIDYASRFSKVTIIRGNHDSENKSDDGVTALSLFANDKVNVITQTWYDHKTKRAFIPHYEDEERIKMDLSAVPVGYTVFGHFGYRGALNSAGDADFDLRLSDFRNRSFLGHVHGFIQRKDVTVLGTPYTTNFGETTKQSYYAIMEGSRVTYKPPSSGPRHILLDHSELLENLDFINDPSWFTMLRVLVDKDSEPIPYSKLNVAFLDIKWKPCFDGEKLSNYAPNRTLFTLNEVIIEDYVDSSITTLSKEDIMEGYSLIKSED